jgi:hypothetical protein
MMRLREIRFWTALVVAGLSLFAIAQGWNALRFGLAEALADSASAESRLQPFAGDDLVGDLADRDLLRLAPPASEQARIDVLGALLSQTPLNGGAWLDLAIARRAAGASMESVAAALALSAMTGPNEARFMVGRVAFALPFWSALPPDARRALIGDLVGGWSALSGDERARLSAILANAPDRSGEEARAALLLNGAAGAAIAAELIPPPPKTPLNTGAPAAKRDVGASTGK